MATRDTQLRKASTLAAKLFTGAEFRRVSLSAQQLLGTGPLPEQP